MKRETFAITMIVAFLLVFVAVPFNLCTVAYAFGADATITSGGTYYLADYASNNKLTINEGLAVTLIGTGDPRYPHRPYIVCNGNDTLTVNDVDLAITDISESAITFLGSGNTLILVNNSDVSAGIANAGICVETGAQLQIKGDGRLSTVGTGGGAGIGGNPGMDSGSIRISSGTIETYGNDGGAGIGGGNGASNGTVLIEGGTTYAFGNMPGGAGIGGGDGGAEGTVTVSGGQVFAVNASGEYDIGPGDALLSSGKITFSDSAVVFTYTDKVFNPTLLDPIEHISSPDLSGTSYRGIPLDPYTRLSKGVYLPRASTPISKIPATGEDITSLYWYVGIGLAALLGIAVILRKRKKMRIQ